MLRWVDQFELIGPGATNLAGIQRNISCMQIIAGQAAPLLRKAFFPHLQFIRRRFKVPAHFVEVGSPFRSLMKR